MSLLDEMFGQCREIQVNPKRPRRCGIYILCLGDEVVYIGSSRDVEVRVETHSLGSAQVPRGKFDRAWWLPIPPKHLDHYEGALIRALRPKFNGRAPADRGCDVEILEGLGLAHLIPGLGPFGVVLRETMDTN